MAQSTDIVEKDWIDLYDSIEPLPKRLRNYSAYEKRKLSGAREEIDKPKIRELRRTEKYKEKNRLYKKIYWEKKKRQNERC